MRKEMKELLQNHIKRGREHTAQQTKRIQRVGELQSRAIFLQAGGKVPPAIREEVLEVISQSRTESEVEEI